MANASNGTTSNSIAPEDIIKILVATDIHLGYAEKHPIKADDSFVTFEEILKMGVDEGVDMVLLAGDLFHENKPSRLAEKKCLSILRKYVLGDRPVTIELVSDPNINFSHCDSDDREVNYANPNMNIGLPVFSIHGNHDDPVGLGGLSALDNLHATGLINYFGRINNLKEIIVTPLLIRKGEFTKMAMYGLSSVKDERLFRLFREGRVHMQRPNEDTEEWFNLLALHQNRAKHGPSNYIPEHFIDSFFDLVIWGHEHECRLTPEHVIYGDNKEYHISQPGSSVATSLCEGEAKEKRVGILEIHGKKFKMGERKLQTIRPMIFRTICIEDEMDFSQSYHLSEKKLTAQIETFLKNYVEKLLREELPKLLTDHPNQPVLPQVRVRVEYTDEKHQLAVGRFGNHFMEKVANPSEILLFRKRVERSAKDEGYELESELMETIMARNLANCTSMEDLIGQYFSQTENKDQLQLLGIKSIGTAVKAFIDKEDKEAINVIVDNQVKKISGALIATEVNDEEVDEELERFRLQRAKESGKEEQDAKEALDDQATRKATQRSKRTEYDDDIDVLDDDDGGDVQEDDDDGWKTSSVAGRGAGRGRARAATRAARATTSTRGRGRGRKARSSEDEDEPMNQTSKRGQRGGRASPAKATRARGARGSAAASRKAPVVTASQQTSILSAFAKQNQAIRGGRGAILYDSDSN